MEKIHSSYDNLLKSNYDLYTCKYSDLKKDVQSWYSEDLKKFDNRTEKSYGDRNNLIKKVTGIISNLFYAYKVGDKFLLMDGYNRLLSDIGETDIDTDVYLKVITDELPDSKLLSIMFSLNAWKLSKSGGGDAQFSVNNFLDRGFRLFLFKMFGIEFHNRERYHYDMEILDEYFRKENLDVAYFNYDLTELFLLFKNDRIVDDIKHILKSNDYDDTVEKQFNHFENFFRGYIRFLNRRRLAGDMGEHLFETYLELLKKDTKFFKKLQGMSWTDSTRKNIFKFFDEIENGLK